MRPLRRAKKSSKMLEKYHFPGKKSTILDISGNTTNYRFTQATGVIRQYPRSLVRFTHSPARSLHSHRLSLVLLLSSSNFAFFSSILIKNSSPFFPFHYFIAYLHMFISLLTVLYTKQLVFAHTIYFSDLN